VGTLEDNIPDIDVHSRSPLVTAAPRMRRLCGTRDHEHLTDTGVVLYIFIFSRNYRDVAKQTHQSLVGGWVSNALVATVSKLNAKVQFLDFQRVRFLGWGCSFTDRNGKGL
jgi:hypothetical protein